ncbi:amino acid transporter, putative [Leishmania tarentolae]|uniref:Amino acid transporter, putative n=1 Tax=Leishmania tarentolae TaxID=5689 RepID=A0A640KNG4_LEITA|nr:amino acid transporter, putative [Leishmania tarentolae]
MDMAQQVIEADQRSREEHVWRRRHTTNPVLRMLQAIMPYDGIVASAFSIGSSTMGGDIIGLPAAFQMSGMGMAIMYLIVVVIITVCTLVLLTIVSNKTGRYSWEMIARWVMRRGWD